MWSPRNPDSPSPASAGFMLLEALVATAVAAVLLAVLMQAFSSVWRSIGAVREETEAMLVARAVIEASTPRHNLAPMSQEGVTGRYTWTVGVVSTELQTTTPAPAETQPQPQTSATQVGARQPDDPRAQPGQKEQEQSEAWTLFRIGVAVRAPSGRRTTLETYRLSRPAR
jgi:type II secretory pathway component PulJ